MLRQVLVVREKETVYSRLYGKSLDAEGFTTVLNTLSKNLFDHGDPIETHDFFEYRITYSAHSSLRLIFMLITDLTDSVNLVKKEIKKFKDEFLMMFEDVFEDATEHFDRETFEIFDASADNIHRNLKPKICLVGFSGVGKTTITSLIKATEIPSQHVPTISGAISTIKIGKLIFALWDFAGQEQFSYLWDNFVKGADAVLVITDSTLENCEKSRFFLELKKQQAKSAKIAVIGNKQDLPGAMPTSEVERIMGVKSYSMVATDLHNREKMITIIADILDMSAEVSPLLAPLLEREKKMAEAEQAINDGEIMKAMHLYEELAELSLTLGDDNVSQVLMERAKKIRQIVQQSRPAEVEATEAARPAVSAPSTPVSETPERPKIAAPPPAAAQQPERPKIGAPPPATAAAPSRPPIVAPNLPASSTPSRPPLVGSGATPRPPITPSTVGKTPAPASPVAPASSPAPAPMPVPAAGGSGMSIDQMANMLAALKKKTSMPGVAPPQVQTAPASPGASIPRPGAIAKPVAPAVTPSAPVAPVTPAVSARPPLTPTPAAVSPVGDLGRSTPTTAEQREDISSKLTEVKIKLADTDQLLIELEMKNISGDLSDADFQDKSTRLNRMKTLLESQKKKYESLLAELG
jgi:small GTP-binding protein